MPRVEIRRWLLKVMIFFIKRKCFDDVRGVRGFGLVLLQQAPSDFFDSFRIQFSDAERVDEPSIDCTPN